MTPSSSTLSGRVAQVAKDDFTVQIAGVLEEFNLKVNQTVQEVLPKVANDAAKQLKATSPGNGSYASGWRQKTTKTDFTIEAVVYNAKKPGLPHLLEHSHLLRNGTRSTPIPHIKDVEIFVQQEAALKLEEALR